MCNDEKEKVNVDEEVNEEIEVEIENPENEEDFEDARYQKFYSKLRKKILNAVKGKAGNKVGAATDYLLTLPDFFVLLTRLVIDKRIKPSTKGFIALIIGYVMMPIDFIPDFIPIIGYLDDLVIVVYSLEKIFSIIDENILLENWSGEQDVLELIKSIVKNSENFIQKNILQKIKKWINKNKK